MIKKDYSKKEIFTTDEIARVCHVTQNSVINWIKKSAIKAYKTPGGHRRVKRHDFIEFLKNHNLPIPDELSASSNKLYIISENPQLRREIIRSLQNSGLHEEFKILYSTNLFEAGMHYLKLIPEYIVIDFSREIETSYEIARIIIENSKEYPCRIIALFDKEEKIDQDLIKKFGIDFATSVSNLVKGILEFKKS